MRRSGLALMALQGETLWIIFDGLGKVGEIVDLSLWAAEVRHFGLALMDAQQSR